MILSVSRRTDIPCYYSDWFMNRLEEGSVVTRNPMNRKQERSLIISPDTVDCIVFWTKDPLNIMNRLDRVDELGYFYYFNFTLTPYGVAYEPGFRPKDRIIETFIKLSGRLGKDRVQWRYDPIIVNDALSISYHTEHFEEMCEKLNGYTGTVIISFVDRYTKLKGRASDGLIKEIQEDSACVIAKKLANIASGYGITVRACCEKFDMSEYGVIPSACIDKSLIEKITGRQINQKRDKNQRINCGCCESVDIGIYNTCKNGCIYCYANYSQASVEKNFLRHKPESAIMVD